MQRRAARRTGKRGLGAGPACYGNGGTASTVTGANVVFSYIDASAFIGGARPLDRAAAEAALDRVTASLGLSRWRPPPAFTASSI